MHQKHRQRIEAFFAGLTIIFALLAVLLEAISKNGFCFKVKADAIFEPEEYSSISRI